MPGLTNVCFLVRRFDVLHILFDIELLERGSHSCRRLLALLSYTPEALICLLAFPCLNLTSHPRFQSRSLWGVLHEKVKKAFFLKTLVWGAEVTERKSLESGDDASGKLIMNEETKKEVKEDRRKYAQERVTIDRTHKT